MQDEETRLEFLSTPGGKDEESLFRKAAALYGSNLSETLENFLEEISLSNKWINDVHGPIDPALKQAIDDFGHYGQAIKTLYLKEFPQDKQYTKDYRKFVADREAVKEILEVYIDPRLLANVSILSTSHHRKRIVKALNSIAMQIEMVRIGKIQPYTLEKIHKERRLWKDDVRNFQLFPADTSEGELIKTSQPTHVEDDE